MELEIDDLALENWYDLLAFLSRPHLGQLAAGIGNRRLSTIVQGFLHKYLQQIILPPINVSKSTNDAENDPPKAIVNLWHNKKWGTEEFPLANWPMPENITNFESIKLSYLDISVLRFLQKFQLNSLFTNVHLHFHTWYMNCELAAVAQIFAHVLPLIHSIDSIFLDGSNLRPCGCGFSEQIPTLSTFGLPNCKPENSNDGKQKAAESPLVITILNMARVLELFATFDNFRQVDWLCKWLYNPRADRKTRVLLLFQGAGYYHTSLLERLKRAMWSSVKNMHLHIYPYLSESYLIFRRQKEAISFFIGIQIGYFGPNSTMPIPDVSTTQLTNSQTHERMSITVRHTAHTPSKQFGDYIDYDHYGPVFMLISRHPVDAAQEWIDSSGKEILEWKRRKQSRKIELDGWHIGIFPVEHSPPPPSPPNFIRKTLLTLKRIRK